jgi:hypothetical protein
LLLDSALLLDTFVSPSLDCNIILDEDFAKLLDITEEDESPEGFVAKSLSSSLQATKKNAKKSANAKCMDPRLREDDNSPG